MPVMIFATPDFGASSYIALFLLIAWFVVLVLVALGVFKGINPLWRGSPKRRVYGCLLLLVSGLVPLVCYLGPSEVFRFQYGDYPLGNYPDRIREGMTADDVVTTLGNPHQRRK